MADNETKELTDELNKLRDQLAELGEKIPKAKSETKAEAVEMAKELLEKKLAEKEAEEKAKKMQEKTEQAEKEAAEKEAKEKLEAEMREKVELEKKANEEKETQTKLLREEIRKELEEEQRRETIVGDILNYSGVTNEDEDYERFKESLSGMDTVQLELALRGAKASAESREIKPKKPTGDEEKKGQMYAVRPKSVLQVSDPTQLDMATQNLILKYGLERKFGIHGLDPTWFERELEKVDPRTYEMMREIESRRKRAYRL